MPKSVSPFQSGKDDNSRRSSSSDHSAGRKTPEKFFSQSSASSTTTTISSASTGRSSRRYSSWSFASCFGGSGVVDNDKEFSRRDSSEELMSHLGSSSGSSSRNTGKNLYGGTNNSKKRMSGRGIYGGRDKPSLGKKSEGTTFTMAEIYKATRNFSPNLKIGQGGYGTVYKGILDDGTVVAIKRAKNKVYDNQLGAEFNSEVKALARIEHLNLVSFLGYLEHEEERIIVVEYVPNGTLREHLDGLRGNPLDLAARMDIAIDVAHAVTYLHMYTDHPIIHRDIKASNILLTENLRAKVADFGFARFGANSEDVSHVSTQVKGTAGYLDPEYLRTYQLTEKSDVYSFGVLLVELISGRRPIEPKKDPRERITPKWVMKKFTEGKSVDTLDPIIPETPATSLALEKILELALHCLAPTRQERPSMRKCAEILWNIRKDYRELLASDPLTQPSHQQSPSISSTEEKESS